MSFFSEPEFKVEETGRSNLREGKKGGKKKKGGGMSMMMMIPQMLMLGFLPFTLASLKVGRFLAGGFHLQEMLKGY